MSEVKPQALGLLAAAAGVMLWIGVPQAQAVRHAVESPLQRAADQAALAAVQALGAGVGPDEAVAVAQERVALASGLSAQVKPSPGKDTVTVKIAKPAENEDAIVSTARYLQPEQPAQWNWRQRFVAKPAPVIVGSSCARNCDPLQ